MGGGWLGLGNADIINGWSTRDPLNINDVRGTLKVLEIVIKVLSGVPMGCKGSKDFKNSYDLKDSYELAKIKKMGS